MTQPNPTAAVTMVAAEVPDAVRVAALMMSGYTTTGTARYTLPMLELAWLVRWPSFRAQAGTLSVAARVSRGTTALTPTVAVVRSQQAMFVNDVQILTWLASRVPLADESESRNPGRLVRIPVAAADGTALTTMIVGREPGNAAGVAALTAAGTVVRAGKATAAGVASVVAQGEVVRGGQVVGAGITITIGLPPILGGLLGG